LNGDARAEKGTTSGRREGGRIQLKDETNLGFWDSVPDEALIWFIL
jgi:hypothetical protein